jgi:glucose-1-phosphate adenylyltransferase
VELDREGVVRGFLEKPSSPPSGTISMGVYVFRTSALHAVLREDSERDTAHDFGRNILPEMVRSGRVLGYRHEGYWQDIGTLDSYYRANLDLLKPDPPFPLEDPRWPVFTPSTEFPPARIGARAEVRSSIVTHGSIVNDRVILDKRVHIGPRARVGFGEDRTPNRSCPEHLSSGITIVGKETRIPEGTTIGRNCRVSANLIEEDFPGDMIPSGGVMERELNVAH